MRKTGLIVVFAAAVLVAGCGQSHDAKRLVSGFLDTNLKSDDISGVSYGKLDSTFYITDSIVKVMRQQADTMKAFKRGIRYDVAEKPEGKLVLMRVKFTQDKEKQAYTFYFDRDIKHVVAFKRY